MVTERHNNASRLIIKALSKGELGESIIFTNSEARMAKRSLALPALVANRT